MRLLAMSEASEEGGEQAPHVAGALPGDVECLRMAERRVAEPDGEVGDGGDGGDAQAAMARHDRLRHGRHADGIGAEPAIGADLRRRLEAGAEQRQVDAVMQREAGVAGGRVQMRAQAAS